MVKKVNAIQTNLTSNLVKKADYDTEIKEIEDKILDHDKHVTTNDLNTFSDTIFDERLKKGGFSKQK